VKVGVVAIHHPHPEHRNELIERVVRAAEVMRRTPGCLSVECWTTPVDDTLITTGQWESRSAVAEAFAAVRVAGVDFEYDERESRPREVLQLLATEGTSQKAGSR
jgi:quinol monooxygenase YgiN